MPDTDYRFTITAQAGGEITITIGHAFGDDDVAALVAAATAVRGER